MSTLGGRLYVAWRTVTNNQTHLFVASSADLGAHFSSRVAADANLVDANHPRLVPIEGKLGLVFQARPAANRGKARSAGTETNWNKLDVYFRLIDSAGTLSPLQQLKHHQGSATYPTLLYERPDHLFVAWTEGSEEGRKIVMARGRLYLDAATKAVPTPKQAASAAGKQVPHEHQ